MIAVKYIQGVAFTYPSKIQKNVTVLPQNYDELLEEVDYNTMISDNTAAYQAYKTEQEAQAVTLVDKQKFITLKEKWNELALDLSVENDALGITEEGKSKEVADAFKDVVYYLSVNTPTEALKSLLAIQPIPTFLPQEKLDALAAKFQALLFELWGE